MISQNRNIQGVKHPMEFSHVVDGPHSDFDTFPALLVDKGSKIGNYSKIA